eukprot:CAMPEP_0171259154 /NCGR_PEP_ID=MMETSP0790-20130122/54778_1 /TAXON_ID=2925 /ORGANISM="Alexandrium catenella, Strain OF101" /LENGTH=447 /DNA_ID=CAMNT_0011727413 /DNA_START=15 /DNA_END=1358 /DNA_ORIENTATION=-
MADAAVPKLAQAPLESGGLLGSDQAACVRQLHEQCQRQQDRLEQRNMLALAVLFTIYFGFRSGCTVVLPLASKELLKDQLQGAEYSPLYQMPFAIWFGMDILLAVPNAFFMRRWGRRPGFLLGACGSFIGSLCAFAVLRFCQERTLAFVLLNASIMIMSSIGMCEFVRYAAAEACSDPDRKSVVVSRVVSGAAIMSMVGPFSASLASSSDESSSLNGYSTFFLGAAGFSVVAMLAAACLRLPPVGGAVGADAPPTQRLHHLLTRPEVASAILAQVAVQFAMIAPMSAVPLRMEDHFPGMRAADFRISSCVVLHVFCMFAPGFVTGELIKRFSLVPVMSAGLLFQAASMATAIVGAIAGASLANYYVALGMLGIGWNLAFVSSTMVLLDSHTPAERTKVTSANEVIRFAANAVGVLVSSTVPWESLNWVCLGFVVLVALVLITRWTRR